VVDCSHGNTGKRHELQGKVWDSIVEQRTAGNLGLAGAMVESNLFPGNQGIPRDLSQLRYGVSITDECVGWEATEEMVLRAYEAMGAVEKAA
jgi:3-deoxy-7-phosphoheptulonate synthase